MLPLALIIGIASAEAASPDGDVEWDGPYSDTTAQFVSPRTFAAGDTLTLRLRAYANDLAGAECRVFFAPRGAARAPRWRRPRRPATPRSTSAGVRQALPLNPIFRAPSNHEYDTLDYEEIDPPSGPSRTSTGSRRTSTRGHAADRRRGVRPRLRSRRDVRRMEQLPLRRRGQRGERARRAPAFEPDSAPRRWLYGGTSATDLAAARQSTAARWLVDGEVLTEGFDGWRLDVPDNAGYFTEASGCAKAATDPTIWQGFRQAVKAAGDDNYISGEIWTDASNVGGLAGDWLLQRTDDAVMNHAAAAPGRSARAADRCAGVRRLPGRLAERRRGVARAPRAGRVPSPARVIPAPSCAYTPGAMSAAALLLTCLVTQPAPATASSTVSASVAESTSSTVAAPAPGAARTATPAVAAEPPPTPPPAAQPPPPARAARGVDAPVSGEKSVWLAWGLSFGLGLGVGNWYADARGHGVFLAAAELLGVALMIATDGGGRSAGLATFLLAWTLDWSSAIQNANAYNEAQRARGAHLPPTRPDALGEAAESARPGQTVSIGLPF